MLRDFIQRARDSFATPEKGLILPVDTVKSFLGGNRPELKLHPHFIPRISCALMINGYQRPAIVKGFESHPQETIKRRIKPTFGDEYIEHYHASPAIVFNDYLMIGKRRGLGIMIYPRMRSLFDPLPTVFGMTGYYSQNDTNLNVTKLILPKISHDGEVTGNDILPITAENVRIAMTFAGACAKQIYTGQEMTLNRNLQVAQQGDIKPPQPTAP